MRVLFIVISTSNFLAVAAVNENADATMKVEESLVRNCGMFRLWNEAYENEVKLVYAIYANFTSNVWDSKIYSSGV